MPTEEEKDKINKLHSLFPSQEIASQLANLVVSKRPLGVSKQSCYTYYKEVYAMKIKESIDSMIKTGDALLYRYSTYCDCDGGISRETLYKMINQAVRYLVDRMDNVDLKYFSWRNSVNIRRSEEKKGVFIEYSQGFKMVTGIKDFKGELVTPGGEGTPKWKLEMNDWLESDSTKPFIKERLTLTEKEMIELKQELAEDIRIMFSVDCTSVKLIKI
jgi:hypothetical protein